MEQLHRQVSFGQRCRLGLQRCTGTHALLPRRCCFNAPLQFLTGIPHIEQGLQNTFVVAGKDTRPDIQRLWDGSLARLVVNTIGHIKRAAATDYVGDLRWFVEELGRRFPAMQDVVQWRDRKRYTQLESASTTTVQLDQLLILLCVDCALMLTGAYWLSKTLSRFCKTCSEHWQMSPALF